MGKNCQEFLTQTSVIHTFFCVCCHCVTYKNTTPILPLIYHIICEDAIALCYLKQHFVFVEIAYGNSFILGGVVLVWMSVRMVCESPVPTHTRYNIHQTADFFVVCRQMTLLGKITS